MPSLNLNGAALDYTELGSGEPIVFVHGSASDSRTFDQQQAEFSQAFRCISYSRRYHFPNAPIVDGQEYDMATQVADLEALLDWLGDKPVNLVGHSYGAYLCLLVAIRKPQLINKLVLAEPPIIPLFTSFPPQPQEILKLLVFRPKLALPIIKFVATALVPATAAAHRQDTVKALELFGKGVLGKNAFANMSPERFEQARANFSIAELLSDSFMLPLQPADLGRPANANLVAHWRTKPTVFAPPNKSFAHIASQRPTDHHSKCISHDA